MAIFGKKPKAEDVMKLLSELTAEELDKVKSALVEKDESADIGEEVEKAEEDIAEKGEDTQTEEDRVDESVGEQEEHHEEDAEKDEADADADAEEVEEAVEEIEETNETADEAHEEHEDVEHASLEYAMKELTELKARVVALEKALESKNEEELEEIGTDADFVDEINNAMPASYLEKAKNMRI